MREPRKITLIGTGLMGVPMGRNLMKAGHTLTVWNRTAERAVPLVEQGARAVPTAAQAIAGAEVVITMLSDGYATEALLADEEVCGVLAEGMLWIDMSSAKPEQARSQSARLSQWGVRHLDAPVSGGTKGAEAGGLAIMAGGEAATFDAAREVFAALGHPVHVGPSGAGQLCKLANQTIVAVTIAAVAEATLLAEKGGADPVALRAALKGGFADSVILQQHGQRMSDGDFAPGGTARIQRKDLDNTLSEAAGLDLELPATQAVRDRFDFLVEDMGGGDLDHAGLYLELKQRNNLA